jgi:hypothetical protein
MRKYHRLDLGPTNPKTSAAEQPNGQLSKTLRRQQFSSSKFKTPSTQQFSVSASTSASKARQLRLFNNQPPSVNISGVSCSAVSS